MSSWLVSPSFPTGNRRLIELAGMDLCLSARIDNVFVYPSDLDIDRFKTALSSALALWPLVTGRLVALNNDNYAIEMSDNPIPVSLVNNTDLSKCPFGSNVVIDSNEELFSQFVDGLKVNKLVDGSSDDALLRIKLTRLVRSGECVMGVSWSHIMSDAAAFLHFLNTISHLYQQLEPAEPAPVFERRLWREDEADSSLWPTMKHLRHALSKTETIQSGMAGQISHCQINLLFSGEQLARLRVLAGENNVTTQDALTAYIILTLNTHCYDQDEQYITRTNTTVNYRGVSDSLAPFGHVANSYMMMLSEDFNDPRSLSCIAMTIRRSILRSRDQKFLEQWLATADKLVRKMVRNDRLPNMWFPKEIVINSNFRYDWAGLVDFGYTDKCRFYTTGTSPKHLRFFRLNPVFVDTEWMPRDWQGVEVAFRIKQELKERFIHAWKQDVKDNFANVNK